MSDRSPRGGYGMHVVDQCLIAAVSQEPDDTELQLLRERMLGKLGTMDVRGVLLDVSRVRVLDSVLFDLLAKTARMMKLLGKETIFVGFQAGVAWSLMDMEVDISEIKTALTMEDGLEKLRGPRNNNGSSPENREAQSSGETDEGITEKQLDSSEPS